MKPTPSQVHVNTPLTNISIAMIQSAEGFVADKVFPVIPGTHQSDIYYNYDRGSFNRNQMKKRAPGTESAGADYAVNTDSYFADIFALHKDVDDAVRANADSVLKPDSDATDFLTLQALINREVAWAAGFFGTGIWATDITGVSGSPGASQVKQWNDSAATPIKDIRAGKTAVQQSTGFKPNTLVLGKPVYDVLCDSPDIIDRVKYGQTAGAPATVNANVMAQLFELDRVLVMEGIQNTANEGATAAHAFIGGKKALLAYVPPSPGLLVPSAGYTFVWNQYIQSALGVAIRRFRMEHLRSDRVEIESAYAQKKVAADLGYFFNSVVA